MEKKTANKATKVRKAVFRAKEETAKAKQAAVKEMKKIKEELAAAEKKASAYIRKNPRKAMAVSAGIGVALGAALAFFTARGRKKK